MNSNNIKQTSKKNTIHLEKVRGIFQSRSLKANCKLLMKCMRASQKLLSKEVKVKLIVTNVQLRATKEK